jgi:predicted RNA binding protein YcfA (HicA-like mRNA interferase family)
MSEKLPVVSGREVLKVLIKQGFKKVGQKGSHVRLKKKIDSKVLITVVPLHKELAQGTLLAILRQTKMEKDDFIKLIKKS